MARNSQDALSESLNRGANSLAQWLERILREYRAEVLWLAIIGGTYAGVYRITHKSVMAAGVFVVSAMLILLSIRPVRRAMGRSLDASKVRRRWDRAVSHCGITHDIPIRRIEQVAVGHRMRIRVGHGTSFADLAMRRERLAASMGAREVIFHRDEHSAATGTVTVIRKVPVVDQNPWHEAVDPAGRQHTLWDPIPLGTDEHGDTMYITLPERGLLIGGIPGTGKALDVETPIPTPDGWATMGDLRKGDRVFDERGQVCRVTNAWAVRYDRPCYEVAFDDGSTIVADADHQWITETMYDRRRIKAEPKRRRHSPYSRDQRPEKRPITTDEIRRTLHRPDGGTNHSIPCARPLEGRKRDLPVSPYAFGCWLGDGDSASEGFTTADATEMTRHLAPERVRLRSVTEGTYRYVMRYMSEPDMPATRVCKCGNRFIPRHRRHVYCTYACRGPWQHAKPQSHGRTLVDDLRTLGVVDNKHIPIAYLRSSVEQRKALLAGLMDTDGTRDKRDGRVSYCSCRKQLALDVCHLVASLGYKPTLTTKRVHGRSEETSTAYMVGFTPDDEVFRLSRKTSKRTTDCRSTTKRRYIVDVRPVPSRPVRCIAVDSSSHLFLAGRGCIATHNSLTLHLLTAWAALDPSVHLHLLDYKRVELSRWRRSADHFGCTIQEGNQILAELVRLMHARYVELERRELVKIPPNDPAFPLHYLGIDELMPFTDNSDRVMKTTFNGYLQEIAALGRAAGIIPVWATQKPQGSVVPTQIRDLVPYRLAFNCATRQASDTILGSDYAAAGWDASALGQGHPGLGLLLEETNLPGRVQIFHLEDDRIRALAARAEAARRRHLQGVP